jgi:hypothetical protein
MDRLDEMPRSGGGRLDFRQATFAAPGERQPAIGQLVCCNALAPMERYRRTSAVPHALAETLNALLLPVLKMLSLSALFGHAENVGEDPHGIGGKATGQIPGQGFPKDFRPQI